MHHGILLKVHGINQKDAIEQANSIMQETICCNTCGNSVSNVNWDYFNFVAVVDSNWIKENRSDRKGVKTVDDLVKHYIEARTEEAKRIFESLVKEMNEYQKAYKRDKKTPYMITNYIISYQMQELESIRDVIEYGDRDRGIYTLHCTSNHYADMTRYTNGKRTFYFWYDRHY